MLYLFRKESGVEYSGRTKGDVLAAIVETLAEMVRVNRPGVVEMLLPTSRGRSAFARLDPITESEKDNVARFGRGDPCDEKAARATIKEKGLAVPDDSLGRLKPDRDPDHSTGESVRLWIKTKLAPAAAEHGVTVADEKGGDIAIIPV